MFALTRVRPRAPIMHAQNTRLDVHVRPQANRAHPRNAQSNRVGTQPRPTQRHVRVHSPPRMTRASPHRAQMWPREMLARPCRSPALRVDVQPPRWSSTLAKCVMVVQQWGGRGSPRGSYVGVHGECVTSHSQCVGFHVSAAGCLMGADGLATWIGVDEHWA